MAEPAVSKPPDPEPAPGSSPGSAAGSDPPAGTEAPSARTENPGAPAETRGTLVFPDWLVHEKTPKLDVGLPAKETILRFEYYHRVSEVGHRISTLYLVDIADRKLYRRPPFLSAASFAAALTGVRAKEAREEIRVGKALRELPLIEKAPEPIPGFILASAGCEPDMLRRASSMYFSASTRRSALLV